MNRFKPSRRKALPRTIAYNSSRYNVGTVRLHLHPTIIAQPR